MTAREWRTFQFAMTLVTDGDNEIACLLQTTEVEEGYGATAAFVHRHAPFRPAIPMELGRFERVEDARACCEAFGDRFLEAPIELRNRIAKGELPPWALSLGVVAAPHLTGETGAIKDRCLAVAETPLTARGWICHACRTYNGEQRRNCKHCAHGRCDVDGEKALDALNRDALLGRIYDDATGGRRSS